MNDLYGDDEWIRKLGSYRIHGRSTGRHDRIVRSSLELPEWEKEFRLRVYEERWAAHRSLFGDLEKERGKWWRGRC